MRSSVLAAALLSLSLVFSIPARTATITNSDLPGSIQSCITAVTCFVSGTSAYDSATASAFQIQQIVGSGVENNWLMRYALVPPSGQSRINPTQTDSFSGYLWMLVKSTYSATETAHPLTLYLDKVTPAPFSMYGQYGDLSLAMSTADLVSGGGYRTYGLDGNNDSYDYGSLSGDVPLPCVAEGCETHAELNLLELMYGDFGSIIALTSFNPSDARGLVYEQRSSYPCYGDSSCATNDVQSFYVSAIPVPAAAWLFGSGLIGLVGISRRKRSAYYLPATNMTNPSNRR
jgi:hypothetical protein